MIRILAATSALLLSATLLRADDWPMWGGRPDRNMVSTEKNLPTTIDPKKDVRWEADLGSTTFGNPVVAGGRVFIGTNNSEKKPRDPAVKGDKGVLMCFAASDGKFLWQAVHDKLSTGDREDFPKIGICSTPCVVGDRLYYISNRAELVCADVAGFTDGKNEGPYTSEVRKGERDADFVWVLDLCREFGVSPHQASASSPVVFGDLVFVHTGHGADTETFKVKNPAAPSFIAVHRVTGKVVWKDASPGAKILNGQWSSPAVGVVDGKPQVAFPGGDGFLYAFEASTGKPLWKLNGKAHEKVPAGEDATPLNYVGTPVYSGNRLIVANGMDPEQGAKPGCLRCVDARSGAEQWKLVNEEFECSLSTVAVHDGLVYAVELSGLVSCIGLETGKRVWRHDMKSTTWGSPLVADGKVYVRNGDGEVVVLQAGREEKVLGNSTLPGLSHGTLVVSNGMLFIAGDSKLYAVGPAK